MRHWFKVTRNDDDSIIITLKIKLSEKDQKSIYQNSNQHGCKSWKDLYKGYKKYGLEWVIHLLRLYINFGKFSKKQIKVKK